MMANYTCVTSHSLTAGTVDKHVHLHTSECITSHGVLKLTAKCVVYLLSSQTTIVVYGFEYYYMSTHEQKLPLKRING